MNKNLVRRFPLRAAGCAIFLSILMLPASSPPTAHPDALEEGVTKLARKVAALPHERRSGRPYVDGVEVTLGVPPSRALLDVQLGKAEIGELSLDVVRRALQSKLNCWASAPVTLYALRFAGSAKSEDEKLVREAISLAVDRSAMAGVLLQKQAEPAAGFLPQWLSGYAFLFDAESDVERAKALRAKLPANLAGVGQPLRVSFDAGNELARLIAERVAVNARAAGFTLQAVKGGARGDSIGSRNESEAQLIAWRYTSLAPRFELGNLAMGRQRRMVESGVPEEADERYAWEKQMMEQRNLVPLVAVAEFAALEPRVRNWSASSWGSWRLADVWLEQGEAADATSGTHGDLKPLAGVKP